MQLRFLPFAREILARAPDVHSVGYLVGQYWSDEADDAVHEQIVPFAERDPQWPQPKDTWEVEDHLMALLGGQDGYWTFASSLPHLDENGSAITAFASFCPEGCHQDMELWESHVLFAVARRGPGGDVDLEIVGRMLRPEWEDRFDVGFTDEHEPPPPPPRSGGLFRRLFER